jgi:anthranilate synthase component 1
VHVPTLHPGEILPLSRRLPVAPDPCALFDRLVNGADRARDVLLLESADDSAGSGGQSVLAVRSALRITCRADAVTVRAQTPAGQATLAWLSERLTTVGGVAPAGEGRPLTGLQLTLPPRPTVETDAERLRAPSSLDALRVLATSWTLRSRPVAAPLWLTGCFSYDLIDQFERLPAARADPVGFPDWVFWLPEAMVRIDHRQRRCTVLVHAFGGGGPALYHDAVQQVERIAAACEQGAAAPSLSSSGHAGTSARAPSTALSGPDSRESAEAGAPAQAGARVEVDQPDAAYAAVVRRLKEHITAGDVIQVVPSRSFVAPCPSPLATYRRLRALNPSPYMFYVQHGDWTLLGASPETCVQVGGSSEERRVVIRPIAGTRPRGRRADGGADVELDTRLEAELIQDEKERAEHLMLVDLARNDVARVSRPGSRRVTRLLTVERYSHVMHLVSEVRGHLREGLDALHAYAACLNMGTLVGAPKLRAAQLLRETEATRRGPYGGAVGYLTCDGELDTAIVIRSALVRDRRAHVRAGAGVVHDSDPQAEAAETARKADAVLAALAGGAGGPSAAVDPARPRGPSGAGAP